MKAASAGLISLLSDYQFAVAELYTITLAAGAVLTLTSGDVELTISAVVYSPAAIERGDITTSAGIEVDECQVTLHGSSATTINGSTLSNLALVGGFDNARVEIKIAIMPVYGDTSAGVLHLFDGNVTDIKTDGFKVELTVSGESIRLDTQIPPLVYQSTCSHTLYDSQCALSRAGYTETVAVTSGSTASSLHFASSQATGFFDLGKVTFTSGKNSGLSRTTRSHVAGTPDVLNLAQALPFAPLVGDTFTVSAGCDKLRTTCTAKFSNAIHFLGLEYVPVPEVTA